MVTARAASDMPTDHDPENRNHMIFWLDRNIGKPQEYIHLKKAFGSNTDPRHETWTMLNDKDYDHLLLTGHAQTVRFDGVRFLLQAFDDADRCLAAFEENQNKHIFFITSGSMGKSIVPIVIERYRNVFTDLVSNEPYSSIYVFCLNMAEHFEWAINYLDYVQMFDFDTNLLQSLTSDIAKYFIVRGKRLHDDRDLPGGLQRLHWAKRLLHQWDKMEQRLATDDLCPVQANDGTNEMNRLIEEFERELPENPSHQDSANSDDDAQSGETSS